MRVTEMSASSYNSSDEALEPCKHMDDKGVQLYELFAEKMVVKLWCEAIYGFVPKTAQSERSKTGKHADWLALPTEIWLIILGYLPQAELYFNVHRVCHKLNALCRDTSLWTTIDFHKMHEDLVSMDANHLPHYGPIRVCKAHFTNLLTVFCDRITSLKMSRSIGDCVLQDATLKYVCMCTSMRKLDLGFCDEVNLIAICQSCPGIVELNLEACSNLQDDDFSSIFSLERLEKLCVSHCASLTNKFLSYLHDLLNFRALICDGVMRVTEMGLIEFFQHQPLMEELVLDGEDMSDDLAISASQLPNLVAFQLSFCESLTSQSIYCFEEKFQLKRLKFRKASEITGCSIRKVFNPDAEFQLQSFTITECESMDDDALICLSQSCPHLRSLTLDWCWNITDQGLCAIVNNCRKLQRLSLVGLCVIRGIGWLDNLDNRLPYLQCLDASDCNNMPDDDLLDLVCRKPTIEVYTYYHDRICVPDASSCTSDTGSSSSDYEPPRKWICPGERGVEVVF